MLELGLEARKGGSAYSVPVDLLASVCSTFAGKYILPISGSWFRFGFFHSMALLDKVLLKLSLLKLILTC